MPKEFWFYCSLALCAPFALTVLYTRPMQILWRLFYAIISCSGSVIAFARGINANNITNSNTGFVIFFSLLATMWVILRSKRWFYFMWDKRNKAAIKDVGVSIEDAEGAFYITHKLQRVNKTQIGPKTYILDGFDGKKRPICILFEDIGNNIAKVIDIARKDEEIEEEE